MEAKLVSEGICAAPNGCFYFSLARFKVHLARANNNVNAAITDLLATAYAAEDEHKAVTVRDERR